MRIETLILWICCYRVECERVREEIERDKESEKALDLEKLGDLKDEEIMNLKNTWQAKTSELLDEVSQLDNKKKINLIN